MGIYLADLADVLRSVGLDVVEVPGWQRRGYEWHDTPDGGLRSVSGGLVHHTAGPHQDDTSSDYPSLRIVRDGRSDVPGPLAQLGLGYSGTWYVIAAGRANHAGRVDDWRYSNPHAIGVEAENPGDGSPWPRVQYDSYVTGCAALGDAYRITWRGHKEAAVPRGRKIDPTFNMDHFRRDLQHPPTTDWLTMATKEDVEDAVWKVLNRQISLGNDLQAATGDKSRPLYHLIRFAGESLIEGRNQHAATEARLVAIQAALRSIADGQGLDGAAIDAAINDAVTRALKDFTITLTTE